MAQASSNAISAAASAYCALVGSFVEVKYVVVSGEKIEGEGFDQLYGVRLTRFCCEKCGKAFAKEPAKYLAALDKAAPKKN